MPFRVRGAWGGAGEAGLSRESVAAYVGKLADHGFNALFLGVKEGDGRICWPSRQFPGIVKPEYRDFDLPAVLLDECRKRGVEAHAWFIDFYEGENGEAYRQHPAWAALDRDGKPTSEETLRGRRYSSVWMCPARRPGYTDQWLVPLYREFASRYEFDTVHHDYIRYPGDLAPDQYCFCDYCLARMPEWAGFVNPSHPDEPFRHDLYDRPYLEAHWEQSPRVLPAQWDSLPRRAKADFLLNGAFFGMGREDLDYFFYTFRVEAVADFARLSHDAVKSANPNVGISAAVFKNPVQSGRFIGQDWRRFSNWVDIEVPMDYRDHFPGTFEQYLDLLEDAIRRQHVWAAEHRSLYVGIAVNFLFKEEPDGPYPPDKLARVLERIGSSGAEGVVIFCTDQLERYGMWETARTAFSR
jgi:uncharacterized lipoprotein YddW (UPF0748 family)